MWKCGKIIILKTDEESINLYIYALVYNLTQYHIYGT